MILWGKIQFKFYSNDKSKESQIVKEENNQEAEESCASMSVMKGSFYNFLTSSDISSSCNLEEPGLRESLVVLVMVVVGGPIALAGEGEKKG